MTRSARMQHSSMFVGFEYSVSIAPPKTSSRYAMVSPRTSSTVTCAPMPTAMVAAFRPTTPPPRITTRPRRVPGTPPRRTPLPPRSFSRHVAPTCTAMRPATSLIGLRSGSVWSSSSMVS